MDRNTFHNQAIGKDPYNDGFEAGLRLDDIKPYRSKHPKLSILMNINEWRRNQLARSLETLCRQEWREFEVLICDNGSKQNLTYIFAIFEQFLSLRTIRLERDSFSACPTRGFRALFPMVRGDVIAIVQPEMMFAPTATKFLYDVHFEDQPDSTYYKMADYGISIKGRPRWPTLKPWFLDETMMKVLDDVDWHTNLHNIHALPSFWEYTGGLGRRTNGNMIQKLEWPWWFVASALTTDPIWKDMPEFEGHASIDLWLLNYRRLNLYVDVTPAGNPLCVHQDHVRINAVPEGEVVDETTIPCMSTEEYRALPLADADELLELYLQYARDTDGLARDVDGLMAMLDRARVTDDELKASELSGVLGVSQTPEDDGVPRSARIQRIHDQYGG